MTPNEVTEMIEEIVTEMPDRLSGNELNQYVATRLKSVAQDHRRALVEALKTYLAFRVPSDERQPHHALQESRIWLALDLALFFHLNELRPDIRALADAVKTGWALDPIDERGVARYLARLNQATTPRPH
jgi:hypothetical protein